MTSIAGPRSRVVRSWRWTIFALMIGGGGLIAAAQLWARGHSAWAAVVALAALAMAAGVFFSSGAAACLSCRSQIAPLSFGDNRYVRCPACGSYSEGEGGAIWPIEPDRVADRPEFALALRDRRRMPDLCCVCGGEASRTERVTLRRAPARVAPMAPRLPNESVEAPHCAIHTGGAELDGEATREYSVEAMKGYLTVLRVRSYRFYQAFRELNGE